jgi:hypothetical protein
MIKVKEKYIGTEVSLFVQGLPRAVVLNEKTDKRVLSWLFHNGSELVEETKPASK